MNIQNLRHKHGTLLTVTQRVNIRLCNYSDAYSLVTGDIAVTGCNANTKLAFKNCARFEKCSAEIDGALADEVDFLNITMQFNEYSDNYSDTSGS